MDRLEEKEDVGLITFIYDPPSITVHPDCTVDEVSKIMITHMEEWFKGLIKERDEALSEVEELRVLVEGYRYAVADRDRYRKALEEIAGLGGGYIDASDVIDIAITALKGGEDE